MRKPDKPTNKLPESFGGIKENFSEDKIASGYEPDTPDILGGANLNYLLNASGENNKYFNTMCDFINDMPVAKTITVNNNNELVYRDWLGGRNFGELVYSSIPLSDSGLKLLDGSLIQGTGIYKNFVDYIASIVNTYSSIFTTEENWQATVTQYGVCGKFVYNSTNNTVRLPKVTGFVEGTVDINALGDIVESGLPQHSHGASETTAGGHNHNRGDMNIWGSVLFTEVGDSDKSTIRSSNGAFTNTNPYVGGYGQIQPTGENYVQRLDFNASRSWTGNTSWNGNHTHSITISNANNNIYKTSANKVQPQSVKMFVYIVVANGINKTDIELDIDDITTDLNYKADIDLSNATSNISSAAKDFFTGLALPSDRYIDLPLGASGTQYTAPADGFFYVRKIANNPNEFVWMQNASAGNLAGAMNVSPYAGIYLSAYIPIVKGNIMALEYTTTGSTQFFRFIYAQGSEV